MNWNDLRTFLAIVDSGTLAGAARKLDQNHSTVFRRLNALEESLDVRLFDRLTEGYVLTPAGERLVALARPAENAVNQIELELAGRDLAPSGKVRVTAAPNIAHTLLPVVIASLRKTHPGIIVEVAAGDSDYDLNRREADIAIRATMSPPEHLVGKKIMDLEWWVCRRSGRRSRDPLSAETLGDFELIGADAAMLRLDVFRRLEAQHADAIVARANDLTTMANLARAGVGYALLPSDQHGQGLLPVLKVPEGEAALWLLTHPDLRGVTRIKVVWDAIADYCESLRH